MDATVTPSTARKAPTYVEKTDPVAYQKKHAQPHDDIAGWGTDADPAMRPAYPMERTPPRLHNVHWDAPAQQEPHVTVYHSTERPGITPVFGTSAPPSGVSGMLRDIAFRYSENDLRHWFILMLADRVNVGEGIVDDLARGQVPNLWKEMGLATEWKYNRKGFTQKVAVMGAVAGVGVWLLMRRRNRWRD